jgi:hypothetical protein
MTLEHHHEPMDGAFVQLELGGELGKADAAGILGKSVDHSQCAVENLDAIWGLGLSMRHGYALYESGNACQSQTADLGEKFITREGGSTSQALECRFENHVQRAIWNHRPAPAAFSLGRAQTGLYTLAPLHPNNPNGPGNVLIAEFFYSIPRRLCAVKKLFATLLMLVLTVAMSAPAFAFDDTKKADTKKTEKADKKDAKADAKDAKADAKDAKADAKDAKKDAKGAHKGMKMDKEKTDKKDAPKA